MSNRLLELCERVLTNKGLEKTSRGMDVIEAAETGKFTDLAKHSACTMWPFDEQYAKAVVEDQIFSALRRLVQMELRLKIDFKVWSKKKRPITNKGPHYPRF